jgi:hypothetical protein
LIRKLWEFFKFPKTLTDHSSTNLFLDVLTTPSNRARRENYLYLTINGHR